ncbi:MAG: hypothetical protein WCX31_09970 [Salinivirgaceae bacterium]
MKKQPVILFLFFLIALISCRETDIFTNDSAAKLSFSTDTVHFDTIFTTIGSTTQQFRFYNKNKEAVKTTIKLVGGSNSNYRLNIDGQSVDELTDYEILGNDSAFVFVEVTIDPLNSNSPLVVEDSIVFYTNGNIQDVNLVAFGQDVHLYKSSIIDDTRTWVNDKPYLVYDSVRVEKNALLTIDPGVNVYFHNQAALWVSGTLKVNGTVEEPVSFSGDRLEEWYRIAPGQWYGVYRTDSQAYLTGGIHFWQGSTNNEINHAVIENGVIGIKVDMVGNGSNPTLILSNSIIKNMSSIGLMAQSSNVLVYNSVIANCGIYAVLLYLGGNYEFYHTTIGNYYEFDSRKTESLALNNYYMIDKIATVFPFNAKFGNCIVYGNIENELVVDKYPTEEAPFTYVFDHCLMKLGKTFNSSDTNYFKDIIRHKDSLPKFIDTYESDYRLDTLSAAKDKGSPFYSNYFPTDLAGKDRMLDKGPDLGAYERIEEK